VLEESRECIVQTVSASVQHRVRSARKPLFQIIEALRPVD
jgi:hypothetical protein